MNIRRFFLMIVAAMTIYMLFLPLNESNQIAVYSGPILNENWFSALIWIKDNTPECSIIATYWDPGHFITGISERPVIFDGASQNTVRTLEIEGNLSDDEIKKAAVIDNYIVEHSEKNGKPITKIITARIQDIGNSLLTNNESKAIAILKKYNMPNEKCSNYSIYYLATGDLIGKSQWWTYFGTWSPATHSGSKYFYIPAQLAQKRPMISDNAIAYVYPISQNEQFVIYEKNASLTALYQQGSNLLKVEKLFFFSGEYGMLLTVPEAEIKGMIWVSPDKSMIIFVPEEITESMFTKMFLFNGQGLKNYELLKNFGGEVKIFKVNLD